MTFVRAVILLQVCWLFGCYRFFGSEESVGRSNADDPTVIDVSDPDAADTSDRVDAWVPLSPLQPAAPSKPVSGAQSSTSTWEPRPTWILGEEIENARDLGGVPLGDARSVAKNAVFRGPPLSLLSASGCAEFARLGIRTVIDLRIPSERTAVPEADCVLDTAAVVTAPLPVPYNVSPSDYVADLNEVDSIAAAFEMLGDPTAYPIYLHCTWGRDRTGVIVAVILRALGASHADILKEYLLSSATVGAYPRSLEAVLAAIEEGGGIEAYLASAGVSGEQLATLRARAVH
jgi:protein-tyrosine phosphatase